ncbi:MAG: TIGR03619 family F420-dependent LLM class oxidoreductase [Dehalococcoidia bacterium]
MKFGTGFALRAAEDASALRATAQAYDEAGLDFVSIGGHLLSAEAGRFADRPTMTYAGPFHEPFVLFSHLAAVTSRLHFRTSILILPLLPTAAVAAQAAELAILSGGRLELGLGLSWNEVEYAALGQNPRTRGQRMDEQLEVLQRLWTEPFVEYEGRWHHFDRVGLNRTVPKIPIWIGSTTDERALRRAARFADGWLPMGMPTDETLSQLRGWVAEAGRDPSTFGLTLRLALGDEPSEWVAEARRLEAMGATHLGLAAAPDLAPAEAQARIVEAVGVLRGELG